MKIECSDKALKVRKGNFVMYDIDYLLDNLAREICLLETYRHNKKTHPQVDYESILSEVRKLSAEDFKGVNDET